MNLKLQRFFEVRFKACMIPCKDSEDVVRTFSRGQLFLIISQNPQAVYLKLYQNNTPAADYCLNKVLGIQPAASLNKRLQHRYFTVNISKFFRTEIFKNITECLLLEDDPALRNVICIDSQIQQSGCYLYPCN